MLRHPAFLDIAGIRSFNYYFHNRERFGLSLEELRRVGCPDDRCHIYVELIEPLQNVNRTLAPHGFELLVKDAYRSREMYELIFAKVNPPDIWGVNFSGEHIEDLLNMRDMPHTTGLAVDAVLWDRAANREIYLRRPTDGEPACFVDFYADATDAEGRRFQELQTLLRETLFTNGFHLGTRREYWHFEYKLYKAKPIILACG